MKASTVITLLIMILVIIAFLALIPLFDCPHCQNNEMTKRTCTFCGNDGKLTFFEWIGQVVRGREPKHTF